MIGSSFSSETSTEHTPELTNALIIMSLDMTSSFFLIISSGVNFSGETVEFGNSGTVYGGSDEFEGCGECIHQDGEISVACLLHYISAECGCVHIESWGISIVHCC
eukprot:554112_1